MMAALLISIFFAGVVIVVQIIQHGVSGEMLGAFLNISAERAKVPLVRERLGKELTQEDRKGFLRAWQSIRARFELDPKVAIIYADFLMSDLLGAELTSQNRSVRRGFYNDSINRRYQIAHAIAKPGNAEIINLGQLERAMELYSSLFEDIVFESTHDFRDIECVKTGKETTHARL